MQAIEDVLGNRTWFDLRATASAHRLHFNTNHDKTAAQHQLAAHMNIKRAYRGLSPTDRQALKALQLAGGLLPLHTFIEAHGEIRPYKPWRTDSAIRPWQRPISSAEKLYYLALIDIVRTGNGQPDYVVITQEVFDLLPPLPRPQWIAPTPDTITPHTLCLSLSLFLGLLLREQPTLLWGRWLAPRHLKQLAALLPQDVPVGPSELQSDQLRLLHYLAEVSGLVAVQAGCLLPTVAAWEWLALSPSDQWAHVLSAWDVDMRRHGHRRYDFYRLPILSRTAWIAWWDALRGPSAYTAGRLDVLLAHVNLLATTETITAIFEPLRWTGWLTVADTQFTTQAAKPLTPHPPVLTQTDDALLLDICADGPAHVRTELLRFITLTPAGAQIDRAAMDRAANCDLTPEEVVRLLAAWLGEPLPMAIYSQLVGWADIQLSLQPMLVLTSTDAQLLADLRADRYLRPRFAGTIGPNAVAVHPAEVPQLRKQLKRRGVRIKCPPDAQPVAGPLDVTAQVYMASRVYQKLGCLVSHALKLPGAITDGLAAELPPTQAAWLDQVAAQVVEQVGQAMEGYAPISGGVTQDDPAGIRAAIENAYNTGTPLTIEYFSPHTGHITTRTITPQLPIAHHHGATYIEAWCDLAQAPRTFRLDRVVSVS